MFRSTPAHRLVRAVGCVLVVAAGCGGPEFPKTHPIRGKVLLPDGTPMPGGHIEFESLAHPDLRAAGSIGPDGTFEAVATYKTTGRETPGLVEGEHRIRIEPPAGDDQDVRRAVKQFPRRYKSYEESGLKVTIPAPGDELIIRLEADKK